jgi:hypothetical protein
MDVNGMYNLISQLSLPHLPCIDPQDFKSSGITVIEGSNGIVPEVLHRLCARSVISLDRDAIFVDGWNSFNPYAVSKVAKSLGRPQKKVLSRIHVARAFTEYQMDALLDEALREAIQSWDPAVLAISYLPSLFSGADGRRLFEPILERIKSLTASSGIITAITSFGGSWYGDRLLAAKADRVVRIEQPSKKLIKIIDNGHVFEYMPVPPGQMRFTDFMNFDFAGDDVYGQDRAFLSHVA